MSARYKDNKLVIANDLRNEIRPDEINKLIPTWGSGDVATDWKLAATNCGNQVLSVAPDQLIIVEGTTFAGNLSMVRFDPITLAVPNKLVYEFHYYGWDSNIPTSSYALFKRSMDLEWGHILEEGKSYTAPLLLGEFGDDHIENYWTFLM